MTQFALRSASARVRLVMVSLPKLPEYLAAARLGQALVSSTNSVLRAHFDAATSRHGRKIYARIHI